MSKSTELSLAKKIQGGLAKRGMDEAIWKALTSSVFPGASAESIFNAVDYCIARHLDVLKKPVHIVPMKVKNSATGSYEYRDVIMPGIYELRTTAARTGQYAGQDEPEYGDDIEYKGVTAPKWCKVTVHRLLQGQRVAFTHKEFFSEACGTKGDGSLNAMWAKRPYGQIAKTAEAGALRKAFPDELGGVHHNEEVHNVIDMGSIEVNQTKADSLNDALSETDIPDSDDIQSTDDIEQG